MHSPRIFIATIVMLDIVLQASGGLRAEDKPLNVIFILVDDWGWTDAGCYGSDLYETPNIDRLARDGMKFTNGYAACTVCSPTRAAVMTGKYPARLHVTDWISGHRRPNAKLAIPEWTKYLDHKEVTIAEALKANGYSTCHIGKWHLGNRDHWPLKQGFDFNIGGTHRGQPPSYFSPYRIPTLKDGPRGEYLTDRESVEAAGFIEANRDKPFFIYLPHYAVHTPIQSKKELAAKYAAKIKTGMRHRNSKYAGMVHSVDEALGRIMAKLDEFEIADRTAIFLTGDNGGLRNVTHNAPLRAGKGSAYEGGVRVPLMVKWPGVTKAGAVCAEPVVTPDFYPTILEMTGAKGDPQHNANVDGHSLVPLLKDASARLERDAIFWHYPHYHPGGATPYSAIRARDWRLAEFFEDNHVELYNLKDDIGETKDLAKENPEKAKELTDRLRAWRKSIGAQLPTPNPNYDPNRSRQRGGKKKASFSKKLVFNLKKGDNLPRNQAPNVGGKPFTLTATFVPEGDGVIVAQGGVGAGYVLYLEKGKLNFVTKHNNKPTKVTVAQSLPKEKVTVTASVAKDGTIVLKANDKEIGRGKASGPLLITPIDGLQVGSDEVSPISDYNVPFKFAGEIESVTIQLEK